MQRNANYGRKEIKEPSFSYYSEAITMITSYCKCLARSWGALTGPTLCAPRTSSWYSLQGMSSPDLGKT